MFIYIYRLVNTGCTNLRHSEAARTDVEVWMPSCQKYTKVSTNNN